MSTTSRRAPSVKVRRHKRVDGSVTETWCVRYFDAHGRRLRLKCRSREHADYERARLALEAAAFAPAPPNDEPDGTMTVAQFWPVWAADARARVQPETVDQHAKVWENRVQPRFGDVQLRKIKPRMVTQWRAQLLAEDIGPEAVRKAMNLL
jgi:hypothetical protein